MCVASVAEGAPERLVVVGSSAGGIDALGELVAGLPPDLAAPVVLAQHLDPRRPSHLTEILQRRSGLTVTTVLESESLRAGVIYVVPADRDVTIVDGEVRVSAESELSRPKPSVDRLFATAADSYGENLVAVVLSGAGSDGAEGARKVKLRGGTVIIQDPKTARFPSMPQSLAPTTVDVVSSIETIGRIIGEIVAADDGNLAASDDELLPRFLAQLRDETGIDFGRYKQPTILRRLHRRMAAVRVATLQEYVRYCTRNPREYERLASAFLIKVTEFFRDPQLYETLRSEIIPALLSDATAAGRELRIWSAGCATGEEAYSLAIVVAEALGDDLPRQTVRIFATDLDNDAIDFARRGIYSASSVANLPEDVIDRYFMRVGDDFEIRKNIRGMTIFGQHDLAQRASFPRIDLAMSRNVLIYFTPELQRRALQLFAFSLREGGYLVLGKAETVGPLPKYFSAENARLKIYRRHGERVLIPPSRGLTLTDGHASSGGPRPRGLDGLGLRAGRTDGRPTQVERADQVLTRLPIGIVVLAQDYDIQFVNTAARQLLGIHGTAVGQDFVHEARDIPSDLLRRGIDQARESDESTIDVRIEAAGTTIGRSLRLTFLAHRANPERHVADAVIIAITDTSEERARADTNTAQLRDADTEATGMRARLTALEESNRELLRANQELTGANADLRSANEDLLVGAEEVQAATEEVETLNEELQATNEELETLNEELQATVEELNTTNDDLEARGVELEETLATLGEQRRLSERDRTRLARLLLDQDNAMLVVDAAGRIVLVNDAWRAAAEASKPLQLKTVPHGVSVTLDALLTDVLAAAARGESVAIDLRGAGPRGGARRYELRSEALLDERRRLRGGIVTLMPRRSRKG
jgi:two-component system CheB/CheR fusion protein